MDYTAEIYKKDARRKNGERLVLTLNYENVSKEGVERYCKANYSLPKYRYEIHETWVVRKNLLTGAEFKERYDTPYYCSPSSETYWSM
jgi:hypothetical protein